MKNLKALTLALMLTVFSSSYALAEYAIGISGAIADIEASGTETEGGETTSADVDNQAAVFSVFVEYTGIVDGLTLGLDYVPVSADVSDSVKSRTDTETSVTDTATETTTSRTQNAQAEIKDHMTLYAQYDLMGSGMYLKLGYVQVDLNTTESLGTGSKYGNETLDGIYYGIGAQSDVGAGFMRLELAAIDYDDISLSSSVARAGVTTNNKIDADLDVTMFKASYGYKF